MTMGLISTLTGDHWRMGKLNYLSM